MYILPWNIATTLSHAYVSTSLKPADPSRQRYVTRTSSFVIMTLSSHSRARVRFDGTESPTRNTHGTCFLLLPSTGRGGEMKEKKEKKKNEIEIYFDSSERKVSFLRRMPRTLDSLDRLFTVVMVVVVYDSEDIYTECAPTGDTRSKGILSFNKKSNKGECRGEEFQVDFFQILYSNRFCCSVKWSTPIKR